MGGKATGVGPGFWVGGVMKGRFLAVKMGV